MKGTRMIHQVRRLPKEGEYVRAKCGFRTNDPRAVAVRKDDIPEGVAACRNACWREGLSWQAKVILIEDLVRSSPGETVPAEELKTILEGRYYTENHRSPKAA
jgi:hypothetical protein